MYNGICSSYYNVADIHTVSQILDIVIGMAGKGITRAELARVTGFSKSTISQHVDTLLKAKLVKEGAGIIDGRKSMHCLFFNTHCAYAISIDIGATSLNVAVCDLAGEPVVTNFQEDVDVNQGPRIILNKAISTVNQLLKENEIDLESIIGLGVGIPSPVDYQTGRASQPPLMQGGWGNYPIIETIQEAFHKPVFVDNDVNIMAIAQYESERSSSDGNFIFVKLGTGIGCGIFSWGKIYRGATGCAGDIGHISVENSDDLCVCGNRGCLENLAGGAAVTRKVLEMARNGESQFLAEKLEAGEKISCRTLKDAIMAQDLVCKEYVYQLGLYIGEVLAKLINYYNPSMVVFGGGLSNLGELLFSAIREKIYRSSTALATRDLQIKCSALGDYAGVKGAAIMVRERIFDPKCFSKEYVKFSSDTDVK
ncbi:MAG: ROK family transcriptional regulator [Lachnospiraceae bacterium]